MIELIITDRLHKRVIIKGREPYMISMRKLSSKEIFFARQIGIRRYYLPSLNEKESGEFFEKFDEFWNQVVKPFDSDHPFWRNAVSSKMQEWESSAAYLTLVLFTITRKTEKITLCLIIVCASIEEENVCAQWGKIYGWNVYKRQFLSLPTGLRKIYQEIKNIAWFFYRMLFALRQKFYLKNTICKKTLSNESTLIVSTFYSNSFQDNKYSDPFFGKLHCFLSANGHKCSYLCMPLEKLNRKFISSIKSQHEVPIYIPYILIGWIKFLSLFLRVLFRRLKIPRGEFMGCNFTKLLEWNSRRFSNSFNLIAEMYFSATYNLCNAHRLERFLINFEGNVFERACIQGFRKSGWGGVVGYCQGVIYPQNLKLRLTSEEIAVRPEPDVYICTGSYSKYLFAKIGNRKSSNIIPGCSLRYVPSSISRNYSDKSTSAYILVTLDGVYNSAIVLDWLMEHSEKLNKFQIIIRPHPNVPLKFLLSQCINTWPGHFKISNSDLKRDIDNSYCVIYRQTSVGMQALLNGVPAIHLSIDLPLPGDPIMELKASRWVVKTSEELVNVLQKIQSMDSKKIIELINKEKKIIEDYLTYPTNENMRGFLTEPEGQRSTGFPVGE
jgi:hypothetical protein